jgi:hypothetical protein
MIFFMILDFLNLDFHDFHDFHDFFHDFGFFKFGF